MSAVTDLMNNVTQVSRDLYDQFLGLSVPKRVGVVVGTGVFYYVTKYLLWRFREKSRPFNAYTTNEEAINGLDLTNQVVIVTGGNNGIGRETARILTKQGAKVIIACRTVSKGEEAKNDILNSLGLTSAKDRLEVMELDLSSLESVRQFAEKFNARNLKINYLINNAGIMALPDYRLSKDGYELQFATNHLGHFYLTTLLMPSLLKRSESETSGGSSAGKKERKPRVITLSSTAHRKPTNYKWTLDLMNESIQSKTFMPSNLKSQYGEWLNYGISKTSNILFARELQKRYGSEIISVSVHPGGVNTGLSKNMDFAGKMRVLRTFLLSPSGIYINFKSIQQGAATTLRCVSMEDNEIEKGHYYANCNDANGSLWAVARKSLDDGGKLASKLWELSQVLIETKGFSINCSHCNPNNRHEQHKQ